MEHLGFSVRLTPEEDERLRELAYRTRRSRGGVLRALLWLVDPKREADVQRLAKTGGAGRQAVQG